MRRDTLLSPGRLALPPFPPPPFTVSPGARPIISVATSSVGVTIAFPLTPLTAISSKSTLMLPTVVYRLRTSTSYVITLAASAAARHQPPSPDSRGRGRLLLFPLPLLILIVRLVFIVLELELGLQGRLVLGDDLVVDVVGRLPRRLLREVARPHHVVEDVALRSVRVAAGRAQGDARARDRLDLELFLGVPLRDCADNISPRV
eukprot:scaffold1044_cov120-Isochrysis_galbana.AAC.22